MLKKLSFCFLLAAFFCSLLVCLPVSAQNPSSPAAPATTPGNNAPFSPGNPQTKAFMSSSGIGQMTIGGIAGAIIMTVLGLMAVIFIVLLIYAGFQWMTAEGNEEKVDKAKQTITRAIIGLVIVLAAYSITYFVFNGLNGAVGGSGTNGPSITTSGV